MHSELLHVLESCVDEFYRSSPAMIPTVEEVDGVLESFAVFCFRLFEQLERRNRLVPLVLLTNLLHEFLEFSIDFDTKKIRHLNALIIEKRAGVLGLSPNSHRVFPLLLSIQKWDILIEIVIEMQH